MPAPKSPEDLRAAIESMFRIRAVESPPAAQTGLRTVWHRGARYAELVSEIDKEGRVVRHELSLFDDVVVWERGRGFVTGHSEEESSSRGAATVSYDLSADDERVRRAAAALKPYRGTDRIIAHLRDLVVAVEAGEKPLDDLGVVTGSNRIPDGAKLAEAASPAARPTPRLALWLIVGGLALAAAGLALMLLNRGGP